MNVEERRAGTVRWVPAGVIDALIDIRAVAERVRAYGQAESAKPLSGAVPTRLAVVAAELESALRSQLVLDSLGARRVSRTPAGEGTETPGWEWIDLDLPVPSSFLLYPEPAPIDSATTLSAAADTLAHVVAVLGDAASGQVAAEAVARLDSIKSEIRDYADSLIEN